MHPENRRPRSVVRGGYATHTPWPVASQGIALPWPDQRDRMLDSVSMSGMQSLAGVRSSEEQLLAADLERLVRDMRAGHQRALAELYDATVGRVFALAQAILRNAEDAEEVACDTYAQAWSGVERYDPGRATVLGWLLMICRSRALDRLRQRRVRGYGRSVDVDEAVDLADEQHGPESLVSLLEQGGRVRSALERLGPERRQLVGLAFLEGLSHQEIADATGLPLGTVKSHLRRALAEMRADLDG
jgi:RNA polymerase sigma-70 factor, ECF subfamily